MLSFILSHTTDGPGAAVLDAALSVDSSPLKAKVSRPLLLAPIVGEPGNLAVRTMSYPELHRNVTQRPRFGAVLAASCSAHSTQHPRARMHSKHMNVAPSSCAYIVGCCAGMLTALHAWDATPAASSSSGGQQLSILQELAASEMCPMRALDYAAGLDWSSARPSLGAVDPARVAQFRAFVQQVKVQRMLR